MSRRTKASCLSASPIQKTSLPCLIAMERVERLVRLLKDARGSRQRLESGVLANTTSRLTMLVKSKH